MVPNDTYGKHIQSCAVGGQYTAIYTDSSALCWNGQGHHQRALWANIYSHCVSVLDVQELKSLLCFPFSCLMAVIRFLLLWFLLSLRPFTVWVSQWLRPKWDVTFVSVVKEFRLRVGTCHPVQLWLSPGTFDNIAITETYRTYKYLIWYFKEKSRVYFLSFSVSWHM